jgi:hypothetical protein
MMNESRDAVFEGEEADVEFPCDRMRKLEGHKITLSKTCSLSLKG